MGEQAYACGTDSCRTYANANIDGTQIITKQDRAPDDATGMIEVLSRQLRNLYRAETHKYCEQVSPSAAEDEEGSCRTSSTVLRTSSKMKLSSLRR